MKIFRQIAEVFLHVLRALIALVISNALYYALIFSRDDVVDYLSYRLDMHPNMALKVFFAVVLICTPYIAILSALLCRPIVRYLPESIRRRLDPNEIC